MAVILDTIDDALADGHQVYVHCWGGIGRTGTTVGCWLVRQGHDGPSALAEVARLFGATLKGQAGRHSPETSAQCDWVKTWRPDPAPPPPHTPTRQDRLTGALIGLAVGDALGTTLEFKRPGTFEPITDMVGGGPFGLAPGRWTDDTSMALCLAESLVETGGFDPADQMRRYVRWWREGHLSSTGRCFDIGTTVRASLTQFERDGQPFAGSTDPRTAGNGSLMRLSPVVMYYADDPRTAVAMAAESSRTTHPGIRLCDRVPRGRALGLCQYRRLPVRSISRGESRRRRRYYRGRIWAVGGGVLRGRGDSPGMAEPGSQRAGARRRRPPTLRAAGVVRPTNR